MARCAVELEQRSPSCCDASRVVSAAARARDAAGRACVREGGAHATGRTARIDKTYPGPCYLGRDRRAAGGRARVHEREGRHRARAAARADRVGDDELLGSRRSRQRSSCSWGRARPEAASGAQVGDPGRRLARPRSRHARVAARRARPARRRRRSLHGPLGRRRTRAPGDRARPRRPRLRLALRRLGAAGPPTPRDPAARDPLRHAAVGERRSGSELGADGAASCSATSRVQRRRATRGCACWTIWNEPNKPQWLRPTSAATYVRKLLNPAYAQIHAVIGAARVGGGMTAPRAGIGGESPVAWIKAMGSLRREARRLRPPSVPRTPPARDAVGTGVPDLRDHRDGGPRAPRHARPPAARAQADLADRVRLPDESS